MTKDILVRSRAKVQVAFADMKNTVSLNSLEKAIVAKSVQHVEEVRT